VSLQIERVQAALARINAMRPDRLNEPQQIRIGLIGRGIAASLTPIMHETEGARLGLPYRYDLIDFDTLALDDRELEPMIAALQSAGFRGCNITFPFKQAVLPLLSELSGEARAIGAVNTVVFRAGEWHGFNTDCSGFAQSFRAAFGELRPQSVMQIGAGGAGAAVAQALVELGVVQLNIVDVDLGKARALAEQVRCANGIDARALPPDDLAGQMDQVDGVVNASPVGMEKLPGLPLDPQLLSAQQFVVDIIYFPRETALIHEARSRGCRVLPGGGMAIYQAVGAFSLFAQANADPREMAKTFAQFA
jgi:shikimate dehydrogenase